MSSSELSFHTQSEDGLFIPQPIFSLPKNIAEVAFVESVHIPPFAISKTDPCSFEGNKDSFPDCPQDCGICKEIHAASRSNWCFDWMRELQDCDTELQHSDKQHQAHFVPKYSDDKVSRIRLKLGILQTKMPAWMLLDKIKDEAIRQKNDTTVPDGDPRKAQKPSHEVLCKFVKCHVVRMLRELNQKIEEEESRLRDSKYDLRTQGPRGWYPILYRNQFHDGIKLVGPVGERPIHVCCLSVNRYAHVVPKDEKNFMQEGILEGIQEYLDNSFDEAWAQYGKDYCAAVGNFIHENSSNQNIDNFDTRNDWTMCREVSSHWYDAYFGKSGSKQPKRSASPPFWRDLLKWYRKRIPQPKGPPHPKQDNHPPFEQSIVKPSSEDQHILALVTRGLYEGESILFPLIAGKKNALLQWLLKRDSESVKRAAASVDESRPTGTMISSPSLVFEMNDNTLELDDRCERRSLAQLSVDGLFFRPMHRRWLTSLSVIKGWHFYFNMKLLDCNGEASSPKSYFGMNVLSFAVSLGDVDIFNLLFAHIRNHLFDVLNSCKESEVKTKAGVLQRFPGIPSLKEVIKSQLDKAIVDHRGKFGNRLLHLAVWNDKPKMYDRLVELGADSNMANHDGLTPFTMAARMGTWRMFDHVWNHHMTSIVWRFGNIEKLSIDLTSFDYELPEHFASLEDIDLCLESLVRQCYKLFQNNSEKGDQTMNKDVNFLTLAMSERLKNLDQQKREDSENLLRIMRDFEIKIKKILEKELEKEIGKKVDSFFEAQQNDGKESIKLGQSASPNAEDEEDESPDLMSAIRLITLYKPEGWYEHTKDRFEEIVMRKWSRGYYLVHIGQNIAPYSVILLLFGLMWWQRALNILEQSFWWAEPGAVQKLQSYGYSGPVQANPVTANVTELVDQLASSALGREPTQIGLLRGNFLGPESTCGWSAILNSYSGRLQACLVFYSVPSLLRLAYTERRFRPSDLDENEDLKISFDEVVHFVYLNLESLLHVIMCGLFVTIGASRVAAGDECELFYIQTEKNATSVASLVLFLNLFIICKPLEGVGLFVLSIYKFLVSDIFNFLVMYSIFFTAFLLALQTLHNANQVYLAWMDYTTTIIPQITGLTMNLSYIVNQNAPSNATQLQITHMVMDGCKDYRRTMYDTAFTLLEISFGDGLADAIQQARNTDFVCAGFVQDRLLIVILALWMILTNVLVLNMLVAMMNFTFEDQRKNVHSVWLLDVSYRIMRYEKLFPELARRMQTPSSFHSFWSYKYWESLFWDVALVLYSIPEVHLWGLPHAIYNLILSVWSKVKIFCRTKVDDKYAEAIADIAKEVQQAFDEQKQEPGFCWLKLEKWVQDRKYKTPIEVIASIVHQKNTINQVEKWKQLLDDAKQNDGPDKLVQQNCPDNLELFLILLILINRISLVRQNYSESLLTSKTIVFQDKESVSPGSKGAHK